MVKLNLREVKIGLVQMEMTDERQKNLDNAVKMIGKAAKEGAQIVCLPELFNSLYFPRKEDSQAIAEPIPGPATQALSKVAKQNRIVLIGGSIYEKAGDKFYNTSVLFDENGKILGKYRKVHVPHDPHYYEQNYFAPGDGYRVFDTKYGKTGVLICFDQWYPEPARINKLMGADLLFYPSAIGWVGGVDPLEGNWQEAWENVQRGHAIANSLILGACNRVGVEGNITFWGRSFVSDQFGKILIQANDREGVFVVSCDLTLGKNIEEGWRFLRNRKPSTYKRLLK